MCLFSVHVLGAHASVIPRRLCVNLSDLGIPMDIMALRLMEDSNYVRWKSIVSNICESYGGRLTTLTIFLF